MYANLNVPELTKAGSSLELFVYAEGEKIGELELGRGGVYWRGGKRHKWKRLSWSLHGAAHRLKPTASADVPVKS